MGAREGIRMEDLLKAFGRKRRERDGEGRPRVP
jgi:hypothetical protein